MFVFETTPDPASVVAGWIPAVLIAVLILATVFLFFSMRKQMRRIHIPPEGVPTHGLPTRKDHEHGTGN
jgi:hypothetical protein